MAVAIAVTPTSPVAKSDACRVEVTGGAVNAGASNTANYPVQDEVRQYLRFVKGGVEYGRSYVFTPGADGTHTFNSYIFPSAGTWSVTLCKASDDTVQATQAVTVQ